MAVAAGLLADLYNHDVKIAKRVVLVLGGGGAARAAVAACLGVGARVRVIARQRAQAESLGSLGQIEIYDWTPLGWLAACDGAALILNATSAGMAPNVEASPWLPGTPLECPSIVVASRNDPWVKFDGAAFWAERWGSRLMDIGDAGHINTESGYGPWPFGLDLLVAMQRVHDDVPLGAISNQANSQRGRHGAVARIRHHTRFTLNRLAGRDI